LIVEVRGDGRIRRDDARRGRRGDRRSFISGEGRGEGLIVR